MTNSVMNNVINMGRKPCGVCLCITKWIPVIFILGVLGWSYYAYVVELCLFTVQHNVEKIAYLLFYHVILVMFVWSYYQTVMTPIGRVPKQFRLGSADQARFEATTDTGQQVQVLERHVAEHQLPVYSCTMARAVRYCDKCRLVKPDRCHHCSVCGECVLKMDHHCPWVNNCVGFANYKFFVLFLGYAFLYCMYIAFTSLQYFIGFWRDGVEGMARFHILFLFFVAVMFGISLISLFSYHCYLVLKNQSTLETFRPAVFQSGPDKRGFSMGRCANFCEVFGDNQLRWFLPVFTSLGDGVSFPMRHQPLSSVSYGSTSDPTDTSVSRGDVAGGGVPGDGRTDEPVAEPRWPDQRQDGDCRSSSSVAAFSEARSDVRLLVE